MYGLRWSRAKAAAFRSAVLGLRSSRPIVPQRMRAGSNKSFYDQVARTEKQWIARGQEIPGAIQPVSPSPS
jgi:hypothetical protein